MNSDKKLFGTDGIRGRANHYPVIPEIALRVGQALGLILKKQFNQEKLSVLIGKDTRRSGYMLEQALASGLNSVGVWVQLTGPLPTPGIGFLTQNMRVAAGVMISASHNPYQDNGIKIFAADGFKIPSQTEREIEELVFSDELKGIDGDEVGRTRRIVDAAGRYIVFAKNSLPLCSHLQGMKLVLDSAHGACYKVAPAIFEELGAQIFSLGNRPNGFNINEKVGALFPKNISQVVLKEKADAGLSLDGDGDRVIMSDEKGRILNGDHILGICAIHLKNQNQLPGNQVVGTHFSNTGLEDTLKSHGIDFVRTNVGDRNVVQVMKERNILLGGESSGHIIFLNHTTTGDGCIAALNVIGAMKAQNKKLSELRDLIQERPQVSLNAPIRKKMDLNTLPGYQELLNSAHKVLDEKSRVVVRFSGTEPLIRVLVEGEDSKTVKTQAQRITQFLSENLS